MTNEKNAKILFNVEVKNKEAVKALNSLVSELQKLDKSAKEITKDLDSSDKSIKNFSQDVNQLSKSLKQGTDNINTANNSIKENINVLAKNKEAINQVNQSIDNKSKAISNLTTSINTNKQALQSNSNEIKKEAENHAITISLLKQERESINNKIEALKIQRKEIKGTSEDKKQERKAISDNILELQKERIALSEKISLNNSVKIKLQETTNEIKQQTRALKEQADIKKSLPKPDNSLQKQILKDVAELEKKEAKERRDLERKAQKEKSDENKRIAKEKEQVEKEVLKTISDLEKRQLQEKRDFAKRIQQESAQEMKDSYDRAIANQKKLEQEKAKSAKAPIIDIESQQTKLRLEAQQIQNNINKWVALKNSVKANNDESRAYKATIDQEIAKLNQNKQAISDNIHELEKRKLVLKQGIDVSRLNNQSFVDQFNNLSKLKEHLSNAEQATNKKTTAFNNLSSASLVLNRVFSGLLYHSIFKIKQIISEATNDIKKFESTIYEIKQLEGENVGGFSNIAKDSVRIADELKESSTVIADAMRIGLAAGLEYGDELENFTKESSKFSKATNTDLKETMNMAIVLKNNFKIAGKDIGIALNQVGVAARESRLDTKDYVAQLGGLASAGMLSNGVLREQITLFSLFANKLKGAEAATATRNLYAKIQNPTRNMEQWAELAQSKGINLEFGADVLKNAGSMEKFLTNFAKSLKEIKNNSTILGDMFGEQRANKGLMQSFLSMLPDEEITKKYPEIAKALGKSLISEFDKIKYQILNDTDYINQAYEISFKSLESRGKVAINSLGNNFKKFFIEHEGDIHKFIDNIESLFNSIYPYLEELKPLISDVFSQFSWINDDDGFKIALKTLAWFFSSAIGLFSSFANAGASIINYSLSGFNAFVTSLMKMTEIVQKYGKKLLNPWDSTARAEALRDLDIHLKDQSDLIVKNYENMIKQIERLGQKVLDSGKAFSKIGDNPDNKKVLDTRNAPKNTPSKDSQNKKKDFTSPDLLKEGTIDLKGNPELDNAKQTIERLLDLDINDSSANNLAKKAQKIQDEYVKQLGLLKLALDSKKKTQKEYDEELKVYTESFNLQMLELAKKQKDKLEAIDKERNEKYKKFIDSYFQPKFDNIKDKKDNLDKFSKALDYNELNKLREENILLKEEANLYREKATKFNGESSRENINKAKEIEKKIELNKIDIKKYSVNEQIKADKKLYDNKLYQLELTKALNKKSETDILKDSIELNNFRINQLKNINAKSRDQRESIQEEIKQLELKNINEISELQQLKNKEYMESIEFLLENDLKNQETFAQVYDSFVQEEIQKTEYLYNTKQILQGEYLRQQLENIETEITAEENKLADLNALDKEYVNKKREINDKIKGLKNDKSTKEFEIKDFKDQNIQNLLSSLSDNLDFLSDSGSEILKSLVNDIETFDTITGKAIFKTNGLTQALNILSKEGFEGLLKFVKGGGDLSGILAILNAFTESVNKTGKAFTQFFKEGFSNAKDFSSVVQNLNDFMFDLADAFTMGMAKKSASAFGIDVRSYGEKAQGLKDINFELNQTILRNTEQTTNKQIEIAKNEYQYSLDQINREIITNQEKAKKIEKLTLEHEQDILNIRLDSNIKTLKYDNELLKSRISLAQSYADKILLIEKDVEEKKADIWKRFTNKEITKDQANKELQTIGNNERNDKHQAGFEQEEKWIKSQESLLRSKLELNEESKENNLKIARSEYDEYVKILASKLKFGLISIEDYNNEILIKNNELAKKQKDIIDKSAKDIQALNQKNYDLIKDLKTKQSQKEIDILKSQIDKEIDLIKNKNKRLQEIDNERNQTQSDKAKRSSAFQNALNSNIRTEDFYRANPDDFETGKNGISHQKSQLEDSFTLGSISFENYSKAMAEIGIKQYQFYIDKMKYAVSPDEAEAYRKKAIEGEKLFFEFIFDSQKEKVENETKAAEKQLEIDKQNLAVLEAEQAKVIQSIDDKFKDSSGNMRTNYVNDFRSFLSDISPDIDKIGSDLYNALKSAKEAFKDNDTEAKKILGTNISSTYASSPNISSTSPVYGNETKPRQGETWDQMIERFKREDAETYKSTTTNANPYSTTPSVNNISPNPYSASPSNIQAADNFVDKFRRNQIFKDMVNNSPSYTQNYFEEKYGYMTTKELEDLARLRGIPGYEKGTDRVPSTQMALLHKDEAVLNKYQAEIYRSGGMANKNIYNNSSSTVINVCLEQTFTANNAQDLTKEIDRYNNKVFLPKIREYIR